MVFVWFERVFVIVNMNYYYMDYIECRDNQCIESNYESIFGIWGDIWIVLVVFDGKEREYIV